MTPVRARRVLEASLFIGACLVSPELTAQSVDKAPPPVVTYGPAARPLAQWSVGDPSLRIGGMEATGASQFFQIVGLTVLEGGTLVVGDGGSSELRYFDLSTGAHLRTAGGQGPGPGEIDRLWSLRSYGAQVLAIDASGRVSHFDRMGRFLQRDPPPISAIGLRLSYFGFFRDGAALAFARPTDTQIEVGSSATPEMRVVRMEEGESRFLLSYPWGVLTRPRGDFRAVIQGFSPSTASAVFPGRFCLGFSERYEIDCFSPSGARLHRIVREDWVPKRVTDAHRRNFIETRINNFHPRLRADARQVYDEGRAIARSYPAFGRFVPSSTGDLWVGPYTPEAEWSTDMHPTPETTTVWSVYSADGDWLSDVTLPPRFYLMWVGADAIVGTLRDDYDVESVVRLEIAR